MEKDVSALTRAVAAELRAERSAQQMTLDTLVEQTGFSKSAISNWLGGMRDLKLPDLDRICDALGVSTLTIMARAMKRREDEA